jgi:hypothetical protein
MLTLTHISQAFPSTRFLPRPDALPVEISLIAQLGHGAGDHLFESVLARQQAHQTYVDELEEPSAKLGGMDLSRGDATSLYSFAVGAKGHPFHRHAGHRVFTAISGSGGAQLRFSGASLEELEQDPMCFLRSLRYVNVPPDCLFTVRFGGETWHQFAPLLSNSSHPAFFALSCHTNELGGPLTDEIRSAIATNSATIPLLTELLPEAVSKLLSSSKVVSMRVPTTALSLDAPAESILSNLCKVARSISGRIRGAWSRRRRSTGFKSDNGDERKAIELASPPAGSLLLKQFGSKFHHEDAFQITIAAQEVVGSSASPLLEKLLDGFIHNSPIGVTRLMRIRNLLVSPFGLRTSTLGCPVSSLLSTKRDCLFGGVYPVLEQSTDKDGMRAQVILGANDKHLRFRSCVEVDIHKNGSVTITLGTRVQYRNIFGLIYMGAISLVHRTYVTPTMLRMAIDHAIPSSSMDYSNQAADFTSKCFASAP